MPTYSRVVDRTIQRSREFNRPMVVYRLGDRVGDSPNYYALTVWEWERITITMAQQQGRTPLLVVHPDGSREGYYSYRLRVTEPQRGGDGGEQVRGVQRSEGEVPAEPGPVQPPAVGGVPGVSWANTYTQTRVNRDGTVYFDGLGSRLFGYGSSHALPVINDPEPVTFNTVEVGAMPVTQQTRQEEIPGTGRIHPEFMQIDPRQVSFTLNREPTRAFVESVARMGVLTPIVVVRNSQSIALGTGREFEVAAGRRRLEAAIRNNMETIPAMVYPVGTPRATAAAMALAENRHRAPNLVSDALAINDMMMAGQQPDEIRLNMGLTGSQMFARTALLNLPATLFEQVRAGAISPSVGVMISRSGSSVRNHFNRVAARGRIERITRAEVEAFIRSLEGDQLSMNVETLATPTPVRLEVTTREDGVRQIEYEGRVFVDRAVDFTVSELESEETWTAISTLAVALERALPLDESDEAMHISVKIAELQDLIDSRLAAVPRG